MVFRMVKTVYDKAMDRIGTKCYVAHKGKLCRGRIVDFSLLSRDRLNTYCVKFDEHYIAFIKEEEGRRSYGRVYCFHHNEVHFDKYKAVEEQAKQQKEVARDGTCKTCRNYEPDDNMKD